MALKKWVIQPVQVRKNQHWIERNHDDLGGSILADGMKSDTRRTGEPVLADATDLITWAIRNPDLLNTDGDTITTHVIDYALNSSTIG
jgi:hypothetical protein